MRYSINVVSGVVVVEIDGPWVNDPREFVIHQEVKKALQEGDEAGVRHVVIDLERCTFMASGGMGSLASIKVSTTACGGRVILCCVSDRVQRALTVAEMWDHFENFDTREKALEAIESSRSPA